MTSLRPRPHRVSRLFVGISNNQRGFSMLEVLVAISLFGIMAVGVSKNAIYGIRFQKNAELGNIATNLAVSKAEQLAGINPGQLDAGYSGTESNVTVTGHDITFTRQTTVTVNADGSRSIEIVVSSPSSFLLSPVTYSTRFAPWES